MNTEMTDWKGARIMEEDNIPTRSRDEPTPKKDVGAAKNLTHTLYSPAASPLPPTVAIKPVLEGSLARLIAVTVPREGVELVSAVQASLGSKRTSETLYVLSRAMPVIVTVADELSTKTDGGENEAT